MVFCPRILQILYKIFLTYLFVAKREKYGTKKIALFMYKDDMHI